MNNTEFRIEAVTFTVNKVELEGILTKPIADGPYPALILLHGSDRSGKEDPYYASHAENLVKSGFAILRYDGPGWGGPSAQNPGFETLEYRTEEALDVVNYLQLRPDIQANQVGLWGISQGGWLAPRAANRSGMVSFVIMLAGPAVSIWQQELERVEYSMRTGFYGENEPDVFSEEEISAAIAHTHLGFEVAQHIGHLVSSVDRTQG